MVYEKAVGWRRTPQSSVRPTESLGHFGGPRLDESRLGATLRKSDDLLVHALSPIVRRLDPLQEAVVKLARIEHLQDKGD